jgi:hypothetical protein
MSLSGNKQNKLIAILAGAGAVENAWEPILKGLQQYNDFPLTADGANSFLARMVYLLRWYSTSPGDFGRKQLSYYLDFLKQIKSSIATEIRRAERQKSIKARPSLPALLDKLVIPYSTRIILVTTNWDTVIPRAIRNILKPHFNGHLKPLHIHGSTANLSTMYLPSEVTKEPYREKKHEMEIGSIHGAMWSALEQAHRVIVYGLSIDPLDSELAQTLAAGWSNPNLEEIFIVDPNHELIAHRVNLLLDRTRDVRVVGLNHATMVEEMEYTIWRHHKPAP